MMRLARPALAYVGRAVIYGRTLEQQEPKLPAGTEGAMPFFSRDGQWIGYWAAGALMKVQTAGGSALKIAPMQTSGGASLGRMEISSLEGKSLS